MTNSFLTILLGSNWQDGQADNEIFSQVSHRNLLLIHKFCIFFSHNDAIQCMNYNPVTHQLASCAVSDFGE